MMTPQESQRIIESTSDTVDAEALAAYERIRRDVRAGIEVRSAVGKAFDSFSGPYREELASSLSKMLSSSIDPDAVGGMKVGDVSLSEALYRKAEETSRVVGEVVRRHAEGFSDARRLALDIFEGYGFRDPAGEPLQVKRASRALPRYLRELMYDPPLADSLEAYYARIQATSVRTPALRASYLDLLDEIETGVGSDALAKKMRVATYEKLRYWAQRIAETELHRAYAGKQAEELLRDSGVEYVQWRLNPTHPEPDICDYFARLNAYGLGPGIYPKGRAPTAPLHPHCRCYLKPRLDLALGTPNEFDPGAGQRLVSSLSLDEGGRIMGSRAKWEAVARGADPTDVWNAAVSNAAYRVRTVSEAGGAYAKLLASLGEAKPDVAPAVSVSSYWSSSTPSGAWHDASFARGREGLKRMIAATGDPRDLLTTPGAHPHMRYMTHIEMDGMKASTLSGQSVWRHEFGHHMDAHFGRGRASAVFWSAGDRSFLEAMASDARSLVSAGARGNLYTAATIKRRALLEAEYGRAAELFRAAVDRPAYLRSRYASLGLDFDEFERVMRAHADFPDALTGIGYYGRYDRAATALELRDAQAFLEAILGPAGTTENRVAGRKGGLGELSDLIGSITKNKVGGTQTGWGHTDAYYKRDREMAPTETFANLVAFYGSEDHAVWAPIIERLAPRTAARFLEFVDDAAR